MSNLLAVAVALLTVVSAALAYAFCFTDTALGGYIPFAFLTSSPILAFFAGQSFNQLKD